MIWILFGIVVYLVIGIILANNTPLGEKEFPGYPTKLTLLWILPIFAYISFGIGLLLIEFCDNSLFPYKPKPIEDRFFQPR
ncbi:MAG: hypothetical protein A3B86_01790 [Candidatus Yanofskybacteria bacterium RIFCSPHIGHO2_02_FULL_38_22b]|uniref:Uncharacterized protein n=1 Tax=Candidatus Yanofskybacteria bacterium RIFCSPHIGHO2_02_FULL_38_22b TaxID=1802673 RepID=A0A1F8F1V7_9BACT|nr:MAG: hypothetical protein A2816_00690 [Candidatus Yanofskybacteria bacterium RIFCSPHIGHO2_01_FULL_39_44]OGN07122.1 MAG: hypothetical protein A3B86_01790 [Candidatus Yanofskybacteria bacterium RIFCSPHIGHO2_02_FULL_38_22b]OGN19972.1 MAG: hypothetical protein A2910_00500 [Candidatus Yanofskybacteria bacterium RIFCSPLOWO2_01_FULL_39_28]